MWSIVCPGVCITERPYGFAAVLARAASAEDFQVATEDGASLGLKHYRPENEAAFNTGRQPVLLMPGVLANFSYLDTHTPEGRSYPVKLPDVLPDWAKGDSRVKSDPMKLDSMAYYLYHRGYDVWLANYRGQGRAPNRSWGWWNADIDHYGIFDVKAVVMKVRELTGKRPVYIGHSMGGTMAYIYLEGRSTSRGSTSTWRPTRYWSQSGTRATGRRLSGVSWTSTAR